MAIRERTLANLIIGLGLVSLAIWYALIFNGGFASLSPLGLTAVPILMFVPVCAYLFCSVGIFLALRATRQPGEPPSLISHGLAVVALVVLIGPLVWLGFR